MRTIAHFVADIGAAATRFGDVYDPNSGQVQARVRLGTAADLDRAVAAAQAAQPAWAATIPMGAQAEALYQMFAGLGGGRLDFSAIIKLIDGSWRAAAA